MKFRFLSLLILGILISGQSFAGVTAITYWTNFTLGTVTLSNWERPGEFMQVDPQTSSSHYKWWIPWVWSQSDVNNKAIEVQVNHQRIGCIFQGKNNDGQDKVRFSKSCNFEYTDTSCTVNGDIGAHVYWDNDGYFVSFARH